MKARLRFATDAALGKLGRHLRAAGFDTCCAHQSRHPDFLATVGRDRVILTRTTAVQQRFAGRPLIFISSNDPIRQMIQVMQDLCIRQEDLRPFSRCLTCNQVVRPVEKHEIRDRVPAYVWQRHSSFKTCRQCRRIYWAGSHRDRLAMRLSAILPSQESDQA